jgi:hypothetical protein
MISSRLFYYKLLGALNQQQLNAIIAKQSRELHAHLVIIHVDAAVETYDTSQPSSLDANELTELKKSERQKLSEQSKQTTNASSIVPYVQRSEKVRSKQ